MSDAKDIEDDSSVADSDIDALTELGNALVDAILEQKPFAAVKALVEAGAPLWYQTEEGMSALHAAAYVQNQELLRFLIERGAIWNAVDNFSNTAGDIALSLNDEPCYTIIRDAGIRSELLLALLSSQTTQLSTPSALVLRQSDTSAAGSIDKFLSSRLRFTRDPHGQDICLLRLEDTEVGVMMGWEREIMRETVDRLCSNHKKLERGLKILNIGFGLGIIDTLFESLHTPPSQHVIVEPHPDVLQHMKDTGWYEKSNVKVLEGKWQDFAQSEELLQGGGFDVVYTDTFSEDYGELQTFFSCLPDLLADTDSRISFFNGLGATNALFYDVYTHLSELHLSEVGIDVQWSDVDIRGHGGAERWGQTRDYFSLPFYRLPIGRVTGILANP